MAPELFQPASSEVPDHQRPPATPLQATAEVGMQHPAGTPPRPPGPSPMAFRQGERNKSLKKKIGSNLGVSAQTPRAHRVCERDAGCQVLQPPSVASSSFLVAAPRLPRSLGKAELPHCARSWQQERLSTASQQLQDMATAQAREPPLVLRLGSPSGLTGEWPWGLF